MADLLAEALERPPGERDVFLDAACGGSSSLRAELDSLIAAHAAQERDGEFLETLDRAGGAALLEHAVADPPVTRAGPYALLRELGRGGMGVVYLGERAEGGFRQRAAIKLVKRGMDSDAILARFLRERQILAGLDHPNVARLLEGGVTDEGQPWFAMELVEGEPLTGYCDSRRLGLADRLRLFTDACRAVQYAHAHLVIHRDLKPGNMLVNGEGRLKLLDFGVAKLLAEGDAGADGAGGLTRAGAHPGTLGYSAPEQVRGATVTTATDVYGLGMVLYELIAGRRPYPDDIRSDHELARMICETAPPAPSKVTPLRPQAARSLWVDLDAVILKALRKEPERRYGSAEALEQEIGRFLAGQPVEARPDSLVYRVSRFVGRHRVTVGVTMAAVVALVAGLLGTAWQAIVAAREGERARIEARRAERVKGFLVEMFEASNPESSGGHVVTARDLLERGTERIEKELSSEPLVQAELLDTIARSFWSLGDFDRALPVAERALEVAHAASGPEDPLVARVLDTLGGIRYSSGDRVAAEETYRQALAMRERLLPPGSPETAESRSDLGRMLVFRGKLDEAETLLRSALVDLRERLGDDHALTALTLIGLAEAAHRRGDIATAADMHAQALAARRRIHGDLHPDVAWSFMALGLALTGNGDPAAGEVKLREGLVLYRKILGEEHPSVARNLNMLGITLRGKGDLKDAEQTFREALAMERKLRGEEHLRVGKVMSNLAGVLAEEGRIEEAMPLFEKAIAILGRVSTPGDREKADALRQHAEALIEARRPREALASIEECMELYLIALGPEHPDIARARVTLAHAWSDLGRFVEAEWTLREILELTSSSSPGSRLTTIQVLMGLSDLLVRQSRAPEAEPLLREAHRLSALSLPETHWQRGDIDSVTGACLASLGKRQEADPLLRSGLITLRSSLGDAHPMTVRALRRFEAAGMPR